MKKSNREIFINNTVYNTAFKMFNQLIALFILPLFIKNMGVEIYGIWIISGITIGYLGLIDLGFTEGIMRYISGAFAKNNFLNVRKAVNTFAVLLFLMGLFIFLIILLFNKQIVELFAIKPENFETARHLLLISGIFAPFMWLTKITSTTLMGILRFKESSWLSGLQSLGVTLTMLYLVLNDYNIIQIAIITNSVSLGLWIPAVFVLKKTVPELSFSSKYFSFEVIKKTIRFGMGVFYAQLIALLALQADNMIIGIAVSMSAVTAYVVASKLFYTSYGYMGMISGVLRPTSYQAYAKNDKVLIDKIMTQGTKYMTMLYSPIGYLGIIISPLFIVTWVGPEFLQYAIWSQAFMAVFIVTSGFGIPINLVFNSGNTLIPNVFKTVTIVVNLTIGILLVKKLGIGGPILGTLIAGFIGPLAFPYFCKLIGTDWKKHMILVLKIIFTNLPSAIIFYLISLNLEAGWINLIVLSISIIFVQFFTLYLVFFSSDEKKDIKLVFRTFSLAKIKISN